VQPKKIPGRRHEQGRENPVSPGNTDGHPEVCSGMSDDTHAIDELLGFWFGDSDDDAAVAASQAKLWWSHDPAVDG